ncbi:hypothetical protein [Comamonas squillarum]|uniref:Uncharacterized protein n=1 Tax=Comamonas squillarum TaxID=2977320 RepID=A0ABY6A3E3_9BURK|nr:hypothetical protein [Comamonas sp. PR12]UXC20049.1 hypothetical protein N4T19_08055 [Comamonas sp. PR12]
MEAKHTPGPWEAIGNLVRSPMYQPDGLPKGMQIAECKDGYSQPFTEEAKANARLIAAAPELLDFIREWLDRQGGDANYMTGKASALIAKATS